MSFQCIYIKTDAISTFIHKMLNFDHKIRWRTYYNKNNNNDGKIE